MNNKDFNVFIAHATQLFAAMANASDSGEDSLPGILSHETIRGKTFLPDFSCAGYGNGIPVFDGRGPGFWQPGHGGFKSTWNLPVIVTGGAYADEVVTVQSLDEGPMARVVGLHGNREYRLDYRPASYVDMLNSAIRSAPSLYEFQKAQRRK